jgi:divalent metal cation (Fe/Co/Zn/Cd) transporter
LTSLVALVAIAGGQIYPFLDPVGGCLVSLLIIRVGYQSGLVACQEIVDRGLDSDVLDSVREGAERGLLQGLKETTNSKQGTMNIGNITGTKSGAYYICDVEVEGPGELTLETFEGIREAVVHGVKEEVGSAKIVRVSIKTRTKERIEKDS